jgi:hypothetical protein
VTDLADKPRRLADRVGDLEPTQVVDVVPSADAEDRFDAALAWLARLGAEDA